MTRKIIRTPQSRRDLVEAAEYISRDNPGAALRLLDAVEEEFRKLAEMPGMGALREFTDPRLGELRSWPVKSFRNYLIFYRLATDSIEIVRVLHGARNIEEILGD